MPLDGDELIGTESKNGNNNLEIRRTQIAHMEQLTIRPEAMRFIKNLRGGAQAHLIESCYVTDKRGVVCYTRP
jgi:hypothetical protein